MRSLLLRNEELTFLDVEGCVPVVNHRKCAINSGELWRVWIHRDEHFTILRTTCACPYASPAKEEALICGETVDNSGITCITHSTKSDIQTTIITDVFAKSELSVHLLSVDNLYVREMINKDLCALVEVLLVLLRPPVALITSLVKLTSLIVKTV